jgi:hypothetical protein
MPRGRRPARGRPSPAHRPLDPALHAGSTPPTGIDVDVRCHDVKREPGLFTGTGPTSVPVRMNRAPSIRGRGRLEPNSRWSNACPLERNRHRHAVSEPDSSAAPPDQTASTKRVGAQQEGNLCAGKDERCSTERDDWKRRRMTADKAGSLWNRRPRRRRGCERGARGEGRAGTEGVWHRGNRRTRCDRL